MRKMSFLILFFIVMFILPAKAYSQIEFETHNITTNADGANSVYAIDVDGDGDTDVLSASNNDHKIAWYENDGEENFSAHIITTDLNSANSVYAIDVDGDGDTDVLSASPFVDNKIAWYENDGDENFSPHVITTNAIGATSVYAEDVDGDGDIDVLSASSDDNKIAWYENYGDENFGPHVISTNANHATSVYAEDVDDDGNMDVLSASFSDDKIAWYENDGDENFIEHVISTNTSGPESVYAIDVDGDGDIDVLAASYFDDKITWYENDGDENFSAHTITTNADGANTVYAADVDNDGDMDVLSASKYDSKIAWYENDGEENFSAHIITTDAVWARSVYAIDVDGDDDIDALSASFNDDKIAWYENIGGPEISVDVENIEVFLQPDAVAEGSFNLSNTGESTLEYQIYTVDTTTGNRNLTGSHIICDTDLYIAGTTAEWSFYVFCNSDDSEWVNEVIIDFPEGVYVNYATDFIGGSEGDLIYDGMTGDGAAVTWFGETVQGWGVILPGEYAVAQVNVSLDTDLENDLVIDYQISGDEYGAEPHTVYGQVVINYWGEQVEWMTLEPVIGEIPAGGSEVIDYQIDATSLPEGLYTCDIYITGNVIEDLTIPVSLTVSSTTAEEEQLEVSFQLSNYPNPFNPSTTISFSLTAKGAQDAKLEIYNVKGQKIKQYSILNNQSSITWDGTDHLNQNVPSGIYLYRLETEDDSKIKKMILLR